MTRIKRTLLAHFFEYEYFIESTARYVIGIVFAASIFFLSNWYNAIKIYREMPSYYGFYILGLSLLTTSLSLLTLIVAFLIPRFEEVFQPRGFKRILSKGREKHITVAVVLVILSLVSAIIFLGYYTEAVLKVG
ncbi:hypothetical protein J4526_03450 [Desulfurococcaceae archaeon MEX13E-LK6-19]|nr:hypothetical protein J4526_03450 [Desulfurococcaceae archaeon MEX13E-LK6-19]